MIPPCSIVTRTGVVVDPRRCSPACKKLSAFCQLSFFELVGASQTEVDELRLSWEPAKAPKDFS